MENNSPPPQLARALPLPWADRLRFTCKAALAMWRLTAKPTIPGDCLTLTYRVEVEA